MNTAYDLIDFIRDAFDELTDSEKIELWNEYCDNNSYDEQIYNMCEFDEFERNSSPLEVLNHIDLSEFDTNDDYIQYTIYGWKSFNDASDGIEEDDLIDWINNNYLDYFFDNYADSNDYVNFIKDNIWDEDEDGDFDEFLEWYDNNYTDELYTWESIEDLVEEWKEEMNSNDEEEKDNDNDSIDEEDDRSEMPWDYGKHFE